MAPLAYLLRHWGKWYYVDLSGTYMLIKDFETVMKRLEQKNANS
jgi:hypothetical protein